MKVVVAPQEFKGTLTATQAAKAIGSAVRHALPGATVVLRPMADGGPGMLDALLAAHRGTRHRLQVAGPYSQRVTARWGILPSGEAIIESAQACGLMHVRGAMQPLTATTRGVGELILAALNAGARSLLIGVGGSATNDGGTGMARALGAKFLDQAGQELPEGGGSLARLDRVVLDGLEPRLASAEIRVLADVDNPLTGPRGAAAIFGPQKGASPEEVALLDGALARLAAKSAEAGRAGFDRINGAGAAGGLGFGLAAFCGATLVPGADEIARALGLRDALHGAGLCITGEGRLDGQTAGGKTVQRVAALAAEAGVPVVAVAGQLGEGWQQVAERLAAVAAISDDPGASACEAARGLRITAETVLSRWRGGSAS